MLLTFYKVRNSLEKLSIQLRLIHFATVYDVLNYLALKTFSSYVTYNTSPAELLKIANCI